MSTKATSKLLPNSITDNLPVAYFDEERKVYQLFVTGRVYGYSWYMEFLQEAKNMGYALEVHIYSYGGEAFEGIAFHDYLKKTFPDNSTAYIYGLAASSATLIACGCTTCYIGANSNYFIHYSEGGTDSTRTAVDDSQVSIYKAKTGLPNEDIRALMQAGTDTKAILNATQAVELGFCNGVIDNEVTALFNNSNTNEMSLVTEIVARLSGKKTEPETPEVEAPAVEQPEAQAQDLTQVLAALKEISAKQDEITAVKAENEALKTSLEEVKAGLKLVADAVGTKIAKGTETVTASAVTVTNAVTNPAVETTAELNDFQKRFMDSPEAKN